MYKIFFSPLFYFMFAHLALLIVLSCLNIKYLWLETKKIDKKVWIVLFFIFLFGFYLRNSEYWLGPFSDGYVYQESAHMWILHGEFVKSCALGNQMDCRLFEQVLFLPGFPFIIVLVHLLFGISSLNASIISAVLSSLTVILVFFSAFLLFRKSLVAVFSALVYALIPINIIYSQTGLSRPTALFFLSLVVINYLLALKNDKYVSWLSFVASLSYLIYIRPEVYTIIPFFLLFIVIFKREESRVFFSDLIKKNKSVYSALARFIFLCLLFGVLQIPALHWLLFNNPIKGLPGGGFYGLHAGGIYMVGKALWLQFFNLMPDGTNLYHYLFFVSVSFVLGFLSLIFNKKKEGFFIVFLFLAYFITTALFYDGNISGTGQLTRDYIRRSLMFHVPYSIIAAYGFYLFFNFVVKSCLLLSRLLFPVIFFGIFLVLVVTLNIRADNLGKMLKEDYNIAKTFFPASLFKDKRADKTGDRILIYPDTDYWNIVGEIPNDCLVITGTGLVVTNDYFADNGRKLAQTDLIFDVTASLFIREIKKNECIYYVENWQCLPPHDNNLYVCRFLKDYLDKEFLYERGYYRVYK